jgi:hypothetical protein
VAAVTEDVAKETLVVAAREVIQEKVAMADIMVLMVVPGPLILERRVVVVQAHILAVVDAQAVAEAV